MNRTELAKQIETGKAFQIKGGKIVITSIIKGAMTFVRFIKNRKEQSMWVGEFLDMLQEELKKMDTDNCTRCKGTGVVKAHTRVQGGRCFRCGGTGKESDYTARKQRESEQAKYRKTQAYADEEKARKEAMKTNYNLYDF